MLRALGERVRRDAVGLEIDHDQRAVLLKEAVHHALQKDLVSGARLRHKARGALKQREADEDGAISKADMFYKQTIKTKRNVDHVETAVEALNLSINEFGTVNLPFILSLYEPDISGVYERLAKQSGEPAENIHLSEDAKAEICREKLIEELRGLIFLNPQEYNENDRNRGWETADAHEFLFRLNLCKS